jgi:uroporphyrinogen decarboxylase
MVALRPDFSPRLDVQDERGVGHVSTVFAEGSMEEAHTHGVRTLREEGEYVLERTPYGALRRQRRDHSTTPEILEYPIHAQEDWLRIKDRLRPEESRIDWPVTRKRYAEARRQGKFVVYRAHMGFAHFLQYMPMEELLVLLAVEPAWATDMFRTQADLVIGLADLMYARGIHYDGAFISCDLGYRNTSFFSPQMYRELQFPFDKRVFRFFRDRGMPAILHSDGCVRGLIPQFIEAGASCLHPLEVKAGMDLIELKREYGNSLAFMGGIDVRAIADPDPLAIEHEIRTKFEVAMVRGGYIYHSDHSVPNNVSFSRYRRVMELVRQYGAY